MRKNIEIESDKSTKKINWDQFRIFFILLLGKNEITSAINKWLYDVDTQKYQVFQEKYCDTAFTKHVHKSKLPFSLKIIVYYQLSYI